MSQSETSERLYSPHKRQRAWVALEQIHSAMNTLRMMVEDAEDIDGMKMIGEMDMYMFKRTKKVRAHLALGYDEP